MKISRVKAQQILRRIAATHDGRYVLDYLDELCRADESVFNPESDRATIYNQGRQSVALHLRQLIKEDVPDA